MVNSAFAHNVYIVKSGDTLSKIVEKNTAPPPPLYGENGRLAKVLALNPSIFDVNRITVGQEILLASSAILVENKLKPAKAQIIEDRMNSTDVVDTWSIGINYGLKYFTLNQSGVLGSTNLAVIVTDTLTISSIYQTSDFSINFDYHSFGLEYETSGNSDSDTYTSFDLYGGYRSFLAGVGTSTKPLFKNDSGSVTLSKFSALSLKLGYQAFWTIKSKKQTQLKFRTLLDYYLSGSSDNLDIEVSKLSGYLLSSSIALSREIIKNPRYQIHLMWPLFFKYQSLKTNLSWGTSDGEISSTGLELGTQLGIEVSF
jgi:hypothetical protein